MRIFSIIKTLVSISFRTEKSSFAFLIECYHESSDKAENSRTKENLTFLIIYIYSDLISVLTNVLAQLTTNDALSIA